MRLHSCSVMVLKKLGTELREEFVATIRYLCRVEGMQVVVEPAELDTARAGGVADCVVDCIDTFAPGEEDGYVFSPHFEHTLRFTRRLQCK